MGHERRYTTKIIVTTLVSAVLATIAVKMRLRQRFSQRTFLSPDDYLIAAGLLCTLALEAIIMFGTFVEDLSRSLGPAPFVVAFV